jgi:hypothetical protein
MDKEWARRLITTDGYSSISPYGCTLSAHVFTEQMFLAWLSLHLPSRSQLGSEFWVQGWLAVLNRMCVMILGFLVVVGEMHGNVKLWDRWRG